MSINATEHAETLLAYGHSFGYHRLDFRDRDNYSVYKTTTNILNFLSYFPIIRIGVGLYRIYNHRNSVADPQASHFVKRSGYGSIARGIVEVLLPHSFQLLLILDVAMTALRHLAHDRLPRRTNFN